jgi:ribosomal protein S8E
MAAHIQRKKEVNDGNHKEHQKRKGKKVRIGREPHRENVRVVGEDKEGPKLSDFAGDRRGRRGPCRRFLAVRIDSSCENDPGGKAKSRRACLVTGSTGTAERRRPWRWWSSASFLAHKLAEKNENGGGVVEAQR